MSILDVAAIEPGGIGNLAGPRMFGTAQEAWRAAVVSVLENGAQVRGVQDQSSVGSAFGEKERSTHELIAVAFALTSPRRRLIHSAHRSIDLGYAIANVLWTLSGSDDVESISFYNPVGRGFSDDGKRLFAAP